MNKRILGFGLASAMAIAAAGASAQNVPAEFVVSGDTAAEIYDYTTINRTWRAGQHLHHR